MHIALFVGLLLLAIGNVAVLLSHISHWDRFYGRRTTYSVEILHYGYAVFILALWPVAWWLRRLWRDGWSAFAQVRSWLPMRVLVYCVFLAIGVTSIASALGLFEFSEFLTRAFFMSTLVAFLGLWALFTLALPDISVENLSSPWRYVDLALMNVVLTLLLLEGAITLWAHYGPPNMAIEAASSGANVEWHRPEPHRPFFNFTLNSGGYNDTEFFRATDRDLVVALLSDSFGLGIVPYAYNFATIAEQGLQEALGDRYERVAIHNFGIPGNNMPEYAFLLHSEALQTNPRYVILCVFVSNDMRTIEKFKHYLFQHWRILVLAQRLFAFHEEVPKGGNVLKIGKPEENEDGVPEHILDPEKEPPTFSEEAFLNVESRRFEMVNTRSSSIEEKYENFFSILGRFHQWLGDKLLVVAIPDEFQVNDDLFEQIVSARQNPSQYRRDYPQERLTAYCEKQGIPILDLLPRLREANKTERVYHLRDTHWNARGNRIAGEAISEFVLSRLKSGG